MTIDELIAIEEIKQLKAAYFRAVDLKRPDEWEKVWTEDATFETPIGVRRGREEIVSRSPLMMDRDSVSVHHGHTPEIEILSPDRARGTWAMSDYVEFPNRDGRHVRFWGYGHYHEEYVKRDGSWRIARSQLTRIRVDRIELRSA